MNINRALIWPYHIMHNRKYTKRYVWKKIRDKIIPRRRSHAKRVWSGNVCRSIFSSSHGDDAVGKKTTSSCVIASQKPNCPHVSSRTLRWQWFQRHLLSHNSVRAQLRDGEDYLATRSLASCLPHPQWRRCTRAWHTLILFSASQYR